MHADEKFQGVDEEMQELCQGILDKIIPRWLRPLETGGRQVQLHLILSDIWADNASWNIDTNMPYTMMQLFCMLTTNVSPDSEMGKGT